MPYKITPGRTALALAVVFLSACATTPDFHEEPPVYPPPPEEARYIYDATIRSSSDIESLSFGQKVQQFATGVMIDPTGLGKPYGVAVTHGRVYISDTQQRAVLMFDLQARKFKTIGTSGKGSLLKPLGLDISSDNKLYVADITAKRIVVFSLEGEYLSTIGSDKILVRPSSVAVSPDASKIYVVDTGGIDSEQHQVFVFDTTSGKLINTIGKRGAGNGEFNIPLQASVSPDGSLHIVDHGNFRIENFSADGSFLSTFGSVGRRSGQFSRPKGIASDKLGNLYVTDSAFGNLQIFDANGTLLLHIGARGTSGGPGKFMLPAGIDVDEDGRVYVVDQFFRKVDIFRPVALPPLHGLPQF